MRDAPSKDGLRGEGIIKVEGIAILTQCSISLDLGIADHPCPLGSVTDYWQCAHDRPPSSFQGVEK
jgi:hypothetical protein